MLNRLVTPIILLAIAGSITGAEQTCACTMNGDDFGSVTPTGETGALVSISPEDHLEDGNNIGKLFSIEGLLFTQNNYTIKMSSQPLAFEDDATCPAGYRKMPLEDANVIINNVKDDNYSLITDAAKMNFPVNEVFFTTTKEFPEETGGGNLEAYKFKAFKPQANATSLTLGVHSTAMQGTVKKTKCVLASSLSAEGLPLGEDYVQFVEVSLNLNKTNVIDYEIEFSGGKKLTSEANVKYAPQTIGCFSTKIKWKMFDGTILTKCDARFVRPYFGSDSTSTLAKEDIVETVYEGVLADRVTSLHFAAATAPMAAKEGGGAYILYKEKDTNALKVQEVDDDMKAVKTIDLGATGTPLALATSAEVGLIVYAQEASDNHHSWLARFDVSGSQKWKKTIMNNGNKPNSVTEQLTFTDSDGEGLPYGMKCMFDPHNGEIAIGRGRIFLTFAHYNNFKCGEASEDNHTGDTMVSCNFEGGNFMLGANWSASHSLTQRTLYDGEKFLTSTLGDAFPQQIKFTYQDGKYNNGYKDGATGALNRFDHIGNAALIPGNIPGDGTGQACGRLGGLSMFNASGFTKFAQVYARKTCTSGYGNNIFTNDVDEIGVVFFDRKLELLSHKTLTTGNDVNVVTSAKYGENIVVLFSRTSREGRSNGLFAPDNYRTDSEDEKTYIMLVSNTGTVVTSPVQLDKNIINNDNLIVLENGNVVWSFVDMDNKLMTYKLTAPASSKPAENPDFAGADEIQSEEVPTTRDPDISVMVTKTLAIALLAFLGFC